MKRSKAGWLEERYALLSTGLKMLLWLSLGLLPLGLIAILASLESASENRLKRAEETRARVEVAAQRINSALARSAFTIRAASAAVALSPPGSGVCETTLTRLARAQASLGRYALYADGDQLRCATPGFTPRTVARGDSPDGAAVDVALDEDRLRFSLYDPEGRLEGAGEFTADALAEIADPLASSAPFDLDLYAGGTRMPLREMYKASSPLSRDVVITAPVLGGTLELTIRAASVPISTLELLMVLLPVLMWLFAAGIGWLIVDRLLLKPLVQMEKAISSYQPGDREIALPELSTPALEIGELGMAFARVTQTVAQHEADLEIGIERQRMLVREVHHRVKNNLQVVASLINLHARSASTEDVAAAYSSIQRRVDALAVVHRNHYAELEENRGVALRSLIAELCANLRASAPPAATGVAIRLDVDSVHVNQDVALSVAFLLTEVVELAMLCDADEVAVSLYWKEGSANARLAVESPSLRGEAGCARHVVERFDRTVVGLSRQLRSELERDPEQGLFAVTLPVLD